MKSALLFLLMSCEACMATAPTPAQVETVGSLAPSYRSIAVAPVARSTDLSVGFQAVDSDDEPTAVAGAGEAIAPDVAVKAAHGF